MSLEGDGMPEVVLGEEVVNGKGEKSDDEEGQEETVDNDSSEEQSDDDTSNGNEDDVQAADGIPTVFEDDMKINFDIIRTKLIKSGRKQFTVYMIIVMKMPGLDVDKAIIERRYNDFCNLQKGLRKECPLVMKNMPHFPRKKLFGGNFKKSLVEDRCRLFEKYLRYIYHQEGVVRTKAFQRFFIKPHLKAATQALMCEQYQESFTQYQLAAHMQQKLGRVDREDMIYALSGVVETSKNLKNYKCIIQAGSECLKVLDFDVSHPFLLALMKSVLDGRKHEMLPDEKLKEHFRDCLERSAYDLTTIKTLRELLVRRC